MGPFLSVPYRTCAQQKSARVFVFKVVEVDGIFDSCRREHDLSLIPCQFLQMTHCCVQVLSVDDDFGKT